MIDFHSEFGKKARGYLEKETILWFTTVGSDHSPQPRPVWFVWDDGSFLIYSQPKANKVRHLLTHPKVSLHFNTDKKADEDVIVFLGTAVTDKAAPAAHKLPAYMEKYEAEIRQMGMTPEQFSQEYSVAIRVTPSTLRGW